jgi:hypothetical protein
VAVQAVKINRLHRASISFRTVPIPRGQPADRDRPAGEWAGKTDYLPDPETVALNQSERTYFLCRAMSVSPGRLPGLALFQTELRDCASKDRAERPNERRSAAGAVTTALEVPPGSMSPRHS